MRFLRYPGGKQKLLSFLAQYLPFCDEIEGTYVEPFVGGGSVFFFIQPQKALLADLNKELIDLYKGIRNSPHRIWQIFEAFPSGKKSYYDIRDKSTGGSFLSYRAARILYLNRTCFKGMWRHNAAGNFNVGYGGEERRWVITHNSLVEVSKVLRRATIVQADFASTLDKVSDGDFLFLDPPYKPGKMALTESHYINGTFPFEDQERLAAKLKQTSERKKIKWLMTNSCHPRIRELYEGYHCIDIPRGTSETIGVFTDDSKEILISNYLS